MAMPGKYAEILKIFVLDASGIDVVGIVPLVSAPDTHHSYPHDPIQSRIPRDENSGSPFRR